MSTATEERIDLSWVEFADEDNEIPCDTKNVHDDVRPVATHKLSYYCGCVVNMCADCTEICESIERAIASGNMARILCTIHEMRDMRLIEVRPLR